MFSSPFLHSSYDYPSDYSYNPFTYSRGPSIAQQHALAAARQQAIDRQRAQRARRFQYLPHESDEDSDDGGSYGDYTPYDQLYLDNIRRKEALERARREEETYNKKLLEAQRQEQLWREHEEQRREQLRQAYRQQQAQKRPVRSPSPPTKKSPSPPPARPETPETLQRRHEAATAIQNAFRIHHSLNQLNDLERQFKTLKESYTLPSTIDFQGPDGIISVPQSSSIPQSSAAPSETNTPKLAFNSANYALHSYIESLNRLLLKLDGVQSWGEISIRKTRRRIANLIEGEASRVDAHWKQAWADYANAGKESVDQDEPPAETQELETLDDQQTGEDERILDGTAEGKKEDIQDSLTSDVDVSKGVPEEALSQDAENPITVDSDFVVVH